MKSQKTFRTFCSRDEKKTQEDSRMCGQDQNIENSQEGRIRGERAKKGRGLLGLQKERVSSPAATEEVASQEERRSAQLRRENRPMVNQGLRLMQRA